MRIYFVIRGANVQDQISEAIKGSPHLILRIGKSPLPQLGKISIKMLDIQFYPIQEGKPIPLSGEKIVTFDVAQQIGNSETGDIDIFVYAKEDGEP